MAVAARDRRAELIRTPIRDGTSLADLGIAPRSERGSWGIAVLSWLPVTGYEIVDLGLAPGDVAAGARWSARSPRRAAGRCGWSTPT